MKVFLLLPILAFLAVSCASSTPAKRVEKNPELHAALSSHQKKLVAEGKIENGMSPDAVYLAWGTPASRAEGQDGGQTFEKWDYTRLTPVYHQSLHGGFGHGFGRSYSGRSGRGFGSRSGRGFGGGHGGGRGFRSYGSFGTGVAYVPYRSAWVKFRNGRVESWQRGKAQ